MIERALIKNPALRYQRVSELIADLELAAQRSGEPETGRPARLTRPSDDTTDLPEIDD